MREFLAHYLFHWTAERAIWLGGQTLSWDSRCAGIYAGFGIALLFHLFFRRNLTKLPQRPLLVAAAILCLPMFIDLLTIQVKLREPVNSIRHFTGVLFGIPFCCILYPAVRHLITASKSSTGLSTASILILVATGSTISALTLWDRTASYYILESLSWTGFTGLAILTSTGLFAMLRPANSQ